MSSVCPVSAKLTDADKVQLQEIKSLIQLALPQSSSGG
jgi:hypothetical protein